MIITVSEGSGVDVVGQAIAVTVAAGSLASVSSLPDGGTADQVLTKIDATDGNAEWRDVAAAISPDAADVDFTPAGNLAATDVQAALEELDTEKSGTGHNHSGTYDPAGSAAAAQSAAEATAASALATHEADTTSVHGIADTSALATGTDVSTAVSDHEAAVDPHPGYLTTAEGAAAYQPLDSDLTAIAALSTTSFGRALLALADAAALRSTAGLVLGTDVYSKSAVDSGFQPLDSDLTAIAALSTTSYGRALLAVSNLAGLQAILGTTGTPSSSTYLRGDGSWSTPSGSSAPVSIDDLTTFNAVFGSALASATDYEFDATNSSTAPSGWSLIGSSPTYRERLGAGVVVCPGGSSWSARGISRSLPSESTWTAYAKVGYAAKHADFFGAGMMLRRTTGGKLTGPLRAYGGGAKFWIADLNSLTSFSTASTTAASPGIPAEGLPFYLRLTKNSATSYDLAFSTDGAAWLPWLSAWNPQTFLGGAPDEIAFIANSENSTQVEVACHWWRVR